MTHLFAANAPTSLDVFLHFPILLILVNFVFSASRFDDWGHIFSHAIKGVVYIITFLGCVFLFLYVGLQIIVPKVFG